MRRCKFDERYFCDYAFMGKETPCEKCPIFHSCGQVTLAKFTKKN